MKFFEYHNGLGRAVKQSGFILLFLLSGCSLHSTMESLEAGETRNTLPDWYHDSVDFQVDGGHEYPDQPALAKLLRDADLAFIQNRLNDCLTLLERAQRISTRESAVYVRLSYLYWVQQKQSQAEQMARRALAVLGKDSAQKQEVQRLLAAIQKR